MYVTMMSACDRPGQRLFILLLGQAAGPLNHHSPLSRLLLRVVIVCWNCSLSLGIVFESFIILLLLLLQSGTTHKINSTIPPNLYNVLRTHVCIYPGRHTVRVADRTIPS